MTNRELITEFYTAFQKKDVNGMAECYAEGVEFEDPAFGQLSGSEVMAMWSMLIQRGGDDLNITFSNVSGDDIGGRATWEATYLFGPKKRRVVNTIDALFVIREGRIVQHIDSFDFWKWSRQALGMPGLLLGWSAFLRNKVRSRSLALLQKYMTQ